MQENKPWLYIPIETKVRELYGKTLLSCFAALRGFNVVIGPKKDIHARISFFPKGIVFNVGLAKNLAKNARKYKESGHKVAAIDEEGIVTLNDDLYLHHRISEETLDVTDMVFCWGKHQADLIARKSNGSNCKIFTTGNPRFDMLRPEYRTIFNKDVEKIKKKYGNFILVNTNFGHGNHFAGEDFLLKSFHEKGWMGNPEDKDFFLQNVQWQKKMLKEFQEIIPELSKNFKDRNIIIRPHPSENHDFWKKVARNFPNVSVVHSGNVIPWLIATDVLIHNGCTTAVESFLLGTKAVAYRPFIVPEQETELPNKISQEIHSMTELIDNLNKIKNNLVSDDRESKKEYLNLYLSGIDGKTASENIAYHLFDNANFSSKGINSSLFFSFRILSYIRKIIRKIFLDSDISESYQLHKISSLSKVEIEEVISDFSKVDKRFINLKIKETVDACFRIYEK